MERSKGAPAHVVRIAFIFLLLCAGAAVLSAQSGNIRVGNQPIPGATVTVSRDGQQHSTVTDADGHFFVSVPTGEWTVEVNMFGFEPLKQVVRLAPGAPVNLQLKLAESPLAARLKQFAARQNGGELALGPNLQGAGGPAGISAQAELQNALNGETPTQFSSEGGGNESFLVTGSLSQGLAQNAGPDTNGFGIPGPGAFGPGQQGVSSAAQSGSSVNGTASGFTQNAGLSNEAGGNGAGGFGPGGGGGGFGGGRGGGGFGGGGGRGFGGGGPRNRQGGFRAGVFGNRRAPNQIHGMLSMQLGNSAVDAKSFSVTGQPVIQPAYAQSRFSALVGGPLIIPGVVKDPSTFFFISYFGTRNRNPNTFTETVPTEAERAGDFSGSITSTGATAQIYDPTTRQLFAGNIIPTSMLNPISLKLLSYFPAPNQPGVVNNYQYLVSSAQNTDNLGFRIQRNVSEKDRLSYQLNVQNRNSQTPQAFGFADPVTGFGIRTSLAWTHNVTPTSINSLTFTFNRNRNETLPFFANGQNVAADLGILGTSSSPLSYGPPNLSFTNFGSLTDSSYTLTRNQSQSLLDGVVLSRGTHTIMFGAQYQRNDLATQTDQNGRGTYTFTGTLTSEIGANGQPVSGTGFDFADYLLGLPESATITYGNRSFYFNENVLSGYIQDDWRINSRLTLLFGTRYEYFQPFTEKYGLLTNLDIAPGYTAVSLVTPESALGAYTGAFPPSLINSDYNNFGPRVGIAWRVPGIKRSTVVRAGYGIYYNGQAYYNFPLQMAQQPPFAVSNNVVSNIADPLTVADGFLGAVPGKNLLNTYAINRYYHTPYAQTWTFSIQHELVHGMFVEGTYVGTKGTDLDVFLSPNSASPGTPFDSENRLPIKNATTFTYDTPVGNSSYNAALLRLAQRFNHGISFRATYTWSKSIDDASSFAGPGGGTVVQNYQDIEAERGLSAFNRGQVFDAIFIFTSRFREHEDTAVARLLKNWSVSGGITAETGMPLTATVLGNQANIAGSGNVGSGRAEATGESIESSTSFFNLDAFTTPPSGQYGNAGRRTIPGPGLFSLNATFGRSFQFGETRRRLEFRVEGNNVLNNVNYSSVNTVVNATNYGLATAAGTMRQLDAVVRFRF